MKKLLLFLLLPILLADSDVSWVPPRSYTDETNCSGKNFSTTLSALSRTVFSGLSMSKLRLR